MSEAVLHIVATPIGNMEDITLRALRVLGETDVLACEDTRVTRKIFERHSLAWPGTAFSYHEHNEEKAGARILDCLAAGKRVALCSDGGMPGISDPGYRIIDAALDAGYTVEVLPGPCAVETALVASGLPTSSYTFKGFPPRKGGKLRTFLSDEKDAPHTLILYESPYRVGALLSAAQESLGNRKAAVCIELTKKFERVERGWLQDLAVAFDGVKIKGEVAVVIAGNHPKFIREDNGK